MKKLTRRDFLKGAAAGAVSLSALPLLSACSGKEAPSPVSDASIAWDKEADIVVVGTGTVITAALAPMSWGPSR